MQITKLVTVLDSEVNWSDFEEDFIQHFSWYFRYFSFRYGLLGASGCGKTTLLSCIIGIIKLNGGHISVLGCTPGEKGSKVPGNGVGYMPQDVVLLPELTIEETLYFFGRIYGMKTDKISMRYHELQNLLELPYGDKYVKQLSGGQQRCVSFAASMVHEPELLILDEPTVGLDPLLREKLWNFLGSISKSQKTTVIITTHYIEESKQADCVRTLIISATT